MSEIAQVNGFLIIGAVYCKWILAMWNSHEKVKTIFYPGGNF